MRQPRSLAATRRGHLMVMEWELLTDLLHPHISNIAPHIHLSIHRLDYAAVGLICAPAQARVFAANREGQKGCVMQHHYIKRKPLSYKLNPQCFRS